VGGASLENLSLDYLVGLNLGSFIHFFAPLSPFILGFIFFLIKEMCGALSDKMSGVRFLKTFKQDVREQIELFMKYG